MNNGILIAIQPLLTQQDYQNVDFFFNKIYNLVKKSLQYNKNIKNKVN